MCFHPLFQQPPTASLRQCILLFFILVVLYREFGVLRRLLPSASSVIVVSKDQNDQTLFVTGNLVIIPVYILPIAADTGSPNKMYEEGTVVSNSLDWMNENNVINASLLYTSSQFVWIHQAMTDRNQPICYPELTEPLLNYQNTTKQLRQSSLSSFFHGTIHIFNWFDGADRLPRCYNMEKLAGLDHVVYWKRSIVMERRFNRTTQSMELGTLATQINGVPVRFVSYPVRTDIADQIQRRAVELQQDDPPALQQQQKHSTHNNETIQHQLTFTTPVFNMSNPRDLTEYLVTLDRPGDVIHHWPVVGSGENGTSATPAKKGVNYLSSQLRTLTSQTLLQLAKDHRQHINLQDGSSQQRLDVVCDFQGVAGRVGRQGRGRAINPYVDSMLRFKIMVVAQRDDWEGHFRLFEALISGAMVLHDRFLAVPYGIEENVNIVFFDNMQDLRNKVLYYLNHTEERLEIARRGRRLAMCHHRSWHRMEQVILGRTITPCEE